MLFAKITYMEHSCQLAYIIGVSLGDGNLSCPNGRATRLRITCDTQYPDIIKDITLSLNYLFPNNKVSHIVRSDNCVDISVYSNLLNEYMPWKVYKGSKYKQQAHVPGWILEDNTFTKACLKGLIQTDGSIYNDRKYKMVNFNNMTKELVDDVFNMMTQLGYSPKKYQTAQRNHTIKYSIRLSKEVAAFLDEIHLYKS